MADFPRPGIQFRDITTLVSHAQGFASATAHLAELAATDQIDFVAGIDARGFIFGAALALQLETGFVPLRKAGKLPPPVLSADYALEYGSATLELDPAAVKPGDRALLIDDLLATGGTALAGVQLLRQAGAIVDQALFVIDLADLGGANALRAQGVEPSALVQFEGH